MDLALIDAIGPFFRGDKRRRINWSKIPFGRLPVVGAEADADWERIRQDMAEFVRRAREMGYTAVTLDDVPHLADHGWWEPEIRERNASLRERIRPVFAEITAAGMEIYLTADFLSTSAGVDKRLGGKLDRGCDWFCETVESVIQLFPEVAGVILRIGESDGKDVDDPIRSRLLLRTAKEVNRMLRRILPRFEVMNRRLIFRTWTVGAYLIGDLIWHRGRLANALRGLDSPALIVSMKYGESDFFRYLPLNRHFFRIDLPKIVEFQARREYEGAGEFPAFIGWEIENYARELAQARNVIGFSVWCQTGGWHGFHRLALLEPASIWIDLNTAVAVDILKNGKSTEAAIAGFFGDDRASAATEFLRHADIAVNQILYIEEFARRKMYFRRVRIPPLLHVYWDCIFINGAVREVISNMVEDPEGSIRAGEAAFESFEVMQTLAKSLKLPEDDVVFMRDTFAIILLARRYFLMPRDVDTETPIREAKRAYKAAWPRSVRSRYRVKTAPTLTSINPRTARWVLRLVIRRQRGYRTVLDRLFTLYALGWIFRIFHRRRPEAVPKFLKKTAMGVESLFR